MQYIAALDYNHLDNGMFLNSFARSLSQQKNVRPIIVHADSEYTERVIQTGVMREEATIRSIKDLNHRLVALFADQGISALGLNGYQRKLVTLNGGRLHLDRAYFDQLPQPTVLLLSSLVFDTEQDKVTAVPLSEFARFLQDSLEESELFIFSSSDSDELFTKDSKPPVMQWDQLDTAFKEEFIPEEFQDYGHRVRLTTAREFHLLPDLDRTSVIH